MKKINWSRIFSHALVGLICIVLTVAVMLGIFVSEKRNDKLYMLQTLIREYFIGEADQTAVEDGAAYGMVAALGDQWSYYIPAEQYASYMEQMNNSYVGVGITISMQEDGSLLVLEVVEGGPAQEAGIQAQDIVTKVDGHSILGMDTNDSKRLIQGEENTRVQITVLRDGQELTFPVTRRAIQTPVAEYQMLEDGIGYVSIANFNSKCADETIHAIETLRSQGAQKLIFDVRNNPGGYANELVQILDYLLPEGKLFTTVDYAGNESTDMSDAECLDIPMAVLVNGDSYSAAEFFAAALSEYDAAVVVGEKTVGKGYFQSTFLLPDGSAVGLSIGKYYTPQGKNLAGVGITPDISAALEEGQTGNDPADDAQVSAAVEALKAK